jgi:hypothetical protein
MPDFCTCGAQLPPDSLFCHKCGRPQREVIAPEPPPESAAEFVPPVAAAAAAGPQPPALNFHNLVALRIAFVIAPVAFLLLLAPPINLLLWIAAGFLAVYFHGRRTGVLLNVRSAVRLGWITGVLMFAVTTPLFTLAAVAVAANGGIVAVLRQELHNNPADPKIQQAIQMLESAPALNTAMVTMFTMLMLLLMLFVFITLLSMAGGALGAKFVSRNQ